MSQFKISDDLSNWGSELSFAHSTALAGPTHLETINELPRGGAGAFKTLNAAQEGASHPGSGLLREKREVSREKRRTKLLSDEQSFKRSSTKQPAEKE